MYNSFNKEIRKRVFGHVFVFLISFILISCTKEIPYPFNSDLKETVLIGFNQVNDSLQIELNQSTNVLDTLVTPINDAFIRLYRNGVLVDTFQNQRNNLHNYKSSIILESNNHYEIVVEQPNDILQIRADDFAPKIPIVENVSIIKNFITTNEEGYIKHYSQLNFTIYDNDPNENFYNIRVYKYINDIDEKFEVWFPLKYNTQSYILQDPYFFDSHYGFLISDSFFKNQNLTYNLIFTDTSVYAQGNDNSFYILEIQNLSSSYYNFLRSYTPYFSENEPFNAFSNVRNGYGILAFFALKRDTITP